MNLKLPLLLGCCLFAAITACAETSASLDADAAGKKKADVYITTADRQQSFNHTTKKLSKTPAFESVITLNPKVKAQTVVLLLLHSLIGKIYERQNTCRLQTAEYRIAYFCFDPSGY